MEILKKCLATIVMVLLLGLVSCSRHAVGGHHAGGNLTKNYHDEHLGNYKHHGQ